MDIIKRDIDIESVIEEMRKQNVSTAVIRRLPRYYRHLNELDRAGMVRISSSALGRSMGLTASQIRQDLSCFGEFGQQGYGYNVGTLLREVMEILGMDRGHTAVLAGVGNLGRALIENFDFTWSGFQLKAAFDVRPEIVGQIIAGTPIFHVDQLENYLKEHPASVGVLTVPRSIAVETAERMIRSQVKGIWNFTNMDLNIHEPGIVVEDVHFSDSLQTLSYLISEEA
ncbi:redox-sensing transcriptional repressor Rex [Pseudoflavonifractor sp. MSJ-37]|uniref:redox-sensing transcriptional repressor Rex n=1 Tax=Pseudoflavonifractor sp. MSJ-37 TaxID=2841531 RepID=UPI0035305060